MSSSLPFRSAIDAIQMWYHQIPSGLRHFGFEAALGLALGVISGIYSGLIVTRMARFDALKNELKRLILSIDYREESQGVGFKLRKDLGDFTSISSDFAYLGHSKASAATHKLTSEILAAIGPNRRTFDEIDKQYLDWQARCRNIKPNLLKIYSLRFWP